jgi:RNA polymerase sigma-70 factor (sigma-E family)
MANKTGSGDPDREVPYELYSEYAKNAMPRLRRIAFSMCGNSHDAEDLAQSALLVAFEHWQDIQRPEAFDQYISTVVRRLWYSDHRTQRWHREILTEEVPDRESPGRSADNTERLLDLKSALSKLGPRQRSAVILRYLNDCTIEETARILGCDGRTVTSQTCRALATLRAIFPREDEASE